MSKNKEEIIKSLEGRLLNIHPKSELKQVIEKKLEDLKKESVNK